jgi:hypothetical protein
LLAAVRKRGISAVFVAEVVDASPGIVSCVQASIHDRVVR